MRRLHPYRLIGCIPGSHRYWVADHGLRIALPHRVHVRPIRSGLAELLGVDHYARPSST